MDSCTHHRFDTRPRHASDVARTCHQIIETHDIHSVIMAISLIASQHRLSHTHTRTHTDSIRQRVIYILCAKNLQQLFTFWTIFMSEIAFGIGVCTKCLILDVTSAELPTDLLWCEQVRARSRPSTSTERLVHLGKIVYLNTRRNDINFMCARRCFFRVHK